MNYKTYKTILRNSPWLRLVNKFHISSRLLEATDGMVFIAFNEIQQTYELHSCRSFQTSASSCCGVVDEQCVNGFILQDYKANELRKFVEDIMSEQMLAEHRREVHEQTRRNLREQMKEISRVLGTTV